VLALTMCRNSLVHTAGNCGCCERTHATVQQPGRP
jgi:hypothetical protein